MRVRWFFLGVAHLPQSKPGFYLTAQKGGGSLFSNTAPDQQGRHRGNLLPEWGNNQQFIRGLRKGVRKPCNNTLFFLFLLGSLLYQPLLCQNFLLCFSLTVYFFLPFHFFLHTDKGFLLIGSPGRGKLGQR